MKVQKYLIHSLCLVVFSFLMGIVVFPKVGEEVATHWGFYGEVNGWSTRAVGVFGMPSLMLIVLLLLAWAPKIKKDGKKMKLSSLVYGETVTILIAFLVFTYLLTMLWNLGWFFNISKAIVPTMAWLFWGMGSRMENISPNWIMGVRTKWTLESDEVWKKTHKLASVLFRVMAVFWLFTLLFQTEVAFLFVTTTVVLMTLFLVFYSWWISRES